MSNGISLYEGAGQGLSKARAVAAGTGADTTTLTFSGKAEMYTDLPEAFRRGGAASTALVLRKESAERQKTTSTALARPEDVVAPIQLPPKVAETSIASGVRTLSKSYKVGDRIVQRKLGWFATPTYIFVTTVERELKWCEDKKLAPAGDWQIEHRRRFRPKAGAATKRVGHVEETLGNAGGDTETRFVEAPEAIPDAFVNGMEAMAYLPLAVRGDIVSQVPHPTYFDGRLLGLCENGPEVTHYEVSLLRMNDDVALVISAKKPLGGSVWEVTQARYELTTPEVEAAT